MRLKIRRINRLIFVVVCLFLVASCTTTRFARWNDDLILVDPQKNDEGKKLESEGDALYLNKEQNDHLYGALTKWKVASQFSPSKELFLKLAKGYLHLANTDSRLGYEFALTYSERALALFDPDIVNSLRSGLPFEKAISNVPKEAGVALLIYATALQKWSEEKGFLTRLRYKKDVNVAMARVFELGIERSDSQLPDSGVEIKR